MPPVEKLSREVANERAERAARYLAADPRVQLVYLFGSAAGSSPFVRDVDLAVLTEPRVTLDELMKLRADIVTNAGGLIDLISLNDASVVLAYEVANSGRCLHSNPPEIEAEFVTRARARYWDFKPYLEAQWRLGAERLRARSGGPED